MSPWDYTSGGLRRTTKNVEPKQEIDVLNKKTELKLVFEKQVKLLESLHSEIGALKALGTVHTHVEKLEDLVSSLAYDLGLATSMLYTQEGSSMSITEKEAVLSSMRLKNKLDEITTDYAQVLKKFTNEREKRKGIAKRCYKLRLKNKELNRMFNHMKENTNSGFLARTILQADLLSGNEDKIKKSELGRWAVKSSSSDKRYTVVKLEDIVACTVQYTCACKGWIYQRKDCRHIKQVEAFEAGNIKIGVDNVQPLEGI